MIQLFLAQLQKWMRRIRQVCLIQQARVYPAQNQYPLVYQLALVLPLVCQQVPQKAHQLRLASQQVSL